ncbi:MAG: lipase family protein, partial [Steroidobacteraceae bacterium]
MASDATRFAAPGGFSYEEARQFIEFCVDLDDQDDRQAATAGPEDSPQIDPERWEKIYDSRHALALDYFTYRARPAGAGAAASAQHHSLPDDDVGFWDKVFRRIEKQAKRRGVTLKDVPSLEGDPALNGFGPSQNAWTLYEGLGPNAGRYAIAIRGTVFKDEPNVVENGLFQPVEGHDFLYQGVTFAEDSNATVHSGFAHATFSLLLDRRYGILPVISSGRTRVPAGSILYIVGHSQGAAMATLVHAFLFNAMRAADASNTDPFGLKRMDYRLKSYDFAQPKPGNYAFSAEFASYT